jgi:hypothetical protein
MNPPVKRNHRKNRDPGLKDLDEIDVELARPQLSNLVCLDTGIVSAPGGKLSRRICFLLEQCPPHEQP